jgi:hypothetical protein
MNTTFNKILISENKLQISEAIKYAENKLQIANKLPSLVKAFLPELETLEIMKLSWNEIDGKIKDTFHFPNATDDHNLACAGLAKEYYELKEFHRLNSWTFDAKILSEKDIEAITESNRQYTENDKQNEAYRLSKSLIADLNRATELGLIPTVRDLLHSRGIFYIAQFTGELTIQNETLVNKIKALK